MIAVIAGGSSRNSKALRLFYEKDKFVMPPNDK